MWIIAQSCFWSFVLFFLSVIVMTRYYRFLLPQGELLKSLLHDRLLHPWYVMSPEPWGSQTQAPLEVTEELRTESGSKGWV